MNIIAEPDSSTDSKADVLGNLPLIESQEDLNKLLGGEVKDEDDPDEGKGGDGKDGKAGKAAAAKPAAPVGKNGAAKGTAAGAAVNLNPDDDPDEDDPDEDLDENGNPKNTTKKFEDYPTMLHYLDEKHKFKLNLKDVENATPAEQAEAVSELFSRMSTATKKAVKEYQYIEQLLQDDEVKTLLKAKHEGKTLKDVAVAFAATPAGMTDDVLAINKFKSQFPKASDDAIAGMVDSLKKSGQFEPFVKSIREQSLEEQRLESEKARKSEEARAKQQAEQEQRELDEFVDYVEKLPNVYGVPMTDEMRETIMVVATERDQEGLTVLDRALQSKEGVVLAALGITKLKELITSGASIKGNKARGKLVDRIFTNPADLQSGSEGGRDDSGKPDYSALNNF